MGAMLICICSAQLWRYYARDRSPSQHVHLDRCRPRKLNVDRSSRSCLGLRCLFSSLALELVRARYAHRKQCRTRLDQFTPLIGATPCEYLVSVQAMCPGYFCHLRPRLQGKLHNLPLLQNRTPSANPTACTQFPCLNHELMFTPDAPSPPEGKTVRLRVDDGSQSLRTTSCPVSVRTSGNGHQGRLLCVGSLCLG